MNSRSFSCSSSSMSCHGRGFMEKISVSINATIRPFDTFRRGESPLGNSRPCQSSRKRPHRKRARMIVCPAVFSDRVELSRVRVAAFFTSHAEGERRCEAEEAGQKDGPEKPKTSSSTASWTQDSGLQTVPPVLIVGPLRSVIKPSSTTTTVVSAMKARATESEEAFSRRVDRASAHAVRAEFLRQTKRHQKAKASVEVIFSHPFQLPL